MLIIWTDCDREGENIGFEIIDVCKAINPRLEVKRAKFSEITRVSMERAMQTLVEPDLLTSQAVDVRGELDLRIGAAFTRFQTMQLQKKFATLSQKLISYYCNRRTFLRPLNRFFFVNFRFRRSGVVRF